MHLVGLDLAWGARNPSGIAVLDAEGRLVHLSSATSDADIVATLRPFTKGPCVVGVDAPLVVGNATGNRPAEAALGVDFARFEAGAHPSNTGKPEFADGTRAARIAQALRLKISPSGRTAGRSTPPARRVVEVYPHAATVALFQLGRTLKYKAKPGRTLPELRAELLRLTGLLDGLAAADPPLHLQQHDGWLALVAQVESATRKSTLRIAEDQVDAVVCAYVALLIATHPERLTTYGDAVTGAIVTPTLPAGLVPSPRRRAAPPDPAATAVQEYAARLPQLRSATDQFVAMVTTMLDDAGINYVTVTGRAKSVESFAAKALRTRDGVPLFADPLRDITDQVGVRVVTYLASDVAAVAGLLSDQLTILDDRDMGQETASEGRFGYASRHLLVAVDARDPARPMPPAYRSLVGVSASVQVRTILQHAWAEFEHDIRYKGTVPEEHVPDLDRRFTLAAGLLELADREFSAIRDRLRASVSDQAGADAEPVAPEVTDPRLGAPELAAFLAGRYEDAGWSKTEHYEWVSGLLLELGITSLDELAALLTSVDSGVIDERMGYRYPAGAVRRLDDALLAAYGERYVALHGNAHRQPLLTARLDKLRATAGSEHGG